MTCFKFYEIKRNLMNRIGCARVSNQKLSLQIELLEDVLELFLDKVRG